MASSETDILRSVLSNEECSKVPEDIREKIESYIKNKSEESVSKALLETTRANFEARVITVEKELSVIKEDNVTKTAKIGSSEKELEELQKKTQPSQVEVTKLQNLVQRLEQESLDFRQQRDSAVEERSSLQRMVDKRNTELERMQEDVRMLNSQLIAATNAKCEAIVKYERVRSQQVALDYKEKQLNEEHDHLQKQIHILTENLNKHTAELKDVRREHTDKLLVLQTELSQITEELHIANKSNDDLKSTNATLVQELETAMQKLVSQRESESKLRDACEKELKVQAHKVQVYKGKIDDATANSKELSSAVKELQKKKMLLEEELSKKTTIIACLEMDVNNYCELEKDRLLLS